ncbi:Aspartic-type endopeptidase ctsD [Penicillium capsulatum]|uniref:penicillopepsin n=1 Tax=Penicillium capsulatum TaxID=69766 RepID=A0A9W9LVS1_9EURO|nr:Aspartic-type endopeptidase ctsD [Penicillium capsulatum]KAJ6122416.1 Aspartic-type endopeptidase ctsD [Penicillium capsulatum]
MHFSPCLVIAALSTTVHAFYPYEITLDATPSSSILEKVQRRFMPWILEPNAEEEDADSEPLSLGIKKLPVRRDYSIIKSSTPSLANSAALNQDGRDFSYFSVVQVGSQKKEMWLALDTGAPSTWVFSSSCTDKTCTSHHTFDNKESSSYASNSSHVKVGYGSGTIGGDLGQDTISIAGLSVSLSFGSATSASKAFSSYPIDGILGLGRSHTAGWTIPSFMDAVAQKKLLKNNLVGFSLSRANDGDHDGSVTFGNVDTTKFDGNISYTATNADTWTIPMDDVYVDGKACNLSDKSATIDTGTTYILVPPADAEKVFALIPGSSKSGENYMIPCNSEAILELSFSGKKYAITPEDYVGSRSADGCVSTIVSHQHSNENTWLVGDVFLKNVYSVFDFDNGQIGFGTRNSSTTSSPSPGNGTFTAPSKSATKSATATATTTNTNANLDASTDAATISAGTSTDSAASTATIESAPTNAATRISFRAGWILLTFCTGMLML